ncbi:venom dipeptidyl peptidase 4-like isoform X2 [Rhynchophorus ferrugineus]|uniref:venom dipeptidyl peptidase 4-like isoform X2 n=1 Tax=Rhynchophorus ferrugineus TaxID=354439 RepID=UPI003FCDBAE8
MMTESTTNSVRNGSLDIETTQSKTDLISSINRRRKQCLWIPIAALVLIVLAVAIYFLKQTTNHSDTPTADTLNLEDLLSYRYNTDSFNGTWVAGDQFLYTSDEGHLMLYDVTAGSSKIILHVNSSILPSAIEFDLSADGRYLLVSHDYQKLYRHSFKARYSVINLETGIRSMLNNGLDLLLVKWAPVGNGLAFIFENNIYYKIGAEANETIQITNTTGFITNGMPDWVYEEEIFSSNKALWFSPDGKKLSFVRFNDSTTPVMVVPVYGEPGSLYFQYPRANIIKYPKAGTPNPTVQLFYVDLDGYITSELEVPTELENLQPVITAVVWSSSDSVVAIWMNRVQNQAAVVLYENGSSVPKIIKSIYESRGWVELFVPPKVSQDGTLIALLLSKTEGKDAFRHLALLDVKEQSDVRFLTGGAYVVTEILGWNGKNNLIYYTATIPTDSSVQHVYSVSPITGDIKCISCSLTSSNGTEKCTYNSAEVSMDSSYLVVTCAGPDIPYITILSGNGEEKIMWTENSVLTELLHGKALPDRKKLEFPVDGGFTAKVMLKLPPNMDTSGNTKYPMLVNVYGGPDTYQVIDKFTLDWGSYLAANKSIIYATIDGRGSGLRGNNLLFSGFRNLGTVEVIDQVNVTRMIQEELHYVDPTRTAIWGWSYGGYAAGMALAMDTKDVFKCGISVAPVTDWTLYDSIYTERFMGLPTPDDNLKGYINGQLLTRYSGLKHKQYFLIHGTFDDNVHYQQSMMWSKVLERNDILFRQLSYPDEDHSLGLVRPHLYHSLENFLDECFETK